MGNKPHKLNHLNNKELRKSSVENIEENKETSFKGMNIESPPNHLKRLSKKSTKRAKAFRINPDNPVGKDHESPKTDTGHHDDKKITIDKASAAQKSQDQSRKQFHNQKKNNKKAA